MDHRQLQQHIERREWEPNQGYLAIEQERLDDRLKYRVDIADALLPIRIPALTLQPLVENAIKHGIAASVEGGTVAVRGWRDAGMVHLTVDDTGSGEGSASGTGEGLENGRRRRRATFGKRARVTHRGAPFVPSAAPA